MGGILPLSMGSCSASVVAAAAGVPSPAAPASGCPLTGPLAIGSSLGSSTLGLGLDTTGLQDVYSSWRGGGNVETLIVQRYGVFVTLCLSSGLFNVRV